MNFHPRIKAAALATGMALAAFSFSTPALAHKCHGSGTITIKEVKHKGKTEFWYIQGGRVCGRFVT